MYARLAFAVAAHVDADILIIDEILSVGDAAFTQKCMRYINRFKAEGTILFVTHDIAAATKLCDRAIWLEDGHIMEDGIAKDVCRHYVASVNAANDETGTFRITTTASDPEKNNTAAKLESETKPKVVIDPRDELLRQSNYANKIKIFEFDPNADWSGHGGAEIRDVSLYDQDGEKKTVVYGGDVVTLKIKVRAKQKIDSPIIGFFVKDRLGQNLFGDNTFLTGMDKDISIDDKKEMSASFTFQLPYLHAGDFSITAAIAENVDDISSSMDR